MSYKICSQIGVVETNQQVLKIILSLGKIDFEIWFLSKLTLLDLRSKIFYEEFCIMGLGSLSILFTLGSTLKK